MGKTHQRLRRAGTQLGVARLLVVAGVLLKDPGHCRPRPRALVQQLGASIEVTDRNETRAAFRIATSS